VQETGQMAVTMAIKHVVSGAVQQKI